MCSNWYDPSEVASRCCWCGKNIDENLPLYALGAKTRPGVDVSQYEGGAMPIKLVAQENVCTLLFQVLNQKQRSVDEILCL